MISLLSFIIYLKYFMPGFCLSIKFTEKFKMLEIKTFSATVVAVQLDTQID